VPATALSGGEAQRVKLAKELGQTGKGRTLYLLDEPTRGLHPADVDRLMLLLNGLVDGGNAVCVVKHNPDLIASSPRRVSLPRRYQVQLNALVQDGDCAIDEEERHRHVERPVIACKQALKDRAEERPAGS